jgi:hypothetical protein
VAVVEYERSVLGIKPKIYQFISLLKEQEVLPRNLRMVGMASNARKVDDQSRSADA